MKNSDYRHTPFHNRIVSIVHIQAIPDEWRGMPTIVFYRTTCSYGLSRSQRQFLCHSRRSGRVSRPASPACRVPAATRRFSSARGSDSCKLVPNSPCQRLIFYAARFPRRRHSAAASFFRPVQCVSRFPARTAGARGRFLGS